MEIYGAIQFVASRIDKKLQNIFIMPMKVSYLT